MKLLHRFALISSLLFFGAMTIRAEIRLPAHFSSHMVLQRDMKVPIWGTAEPGEVVIVEFAGQEKSTRVESDGKWRIDLRPMRASSKSRVLAIKGSKTRTPVTFDDVLVGDVWLCSGQSNMDFTVAKTPKYYFAGVTNADQEVADANYPLIRMFTGAWRRSYAPQDEVPGEWRICTPQNVREFSAVGYFFARDLQKEIKVPVGILTLTYGASTAEAWVSREALSAVPELKPLLDAFDEKASVYPAEQRQAALEAQKQWEQQIKTETDVVNRLKEPKNPDPANDQHNPTVMFNGMVAPVIPYAIKGVLWYQGESIKNGSEGVKLYPLVQSTLVQDWRKRWGEGDFPFYIVQLAANKAPAAEPGESNIANVRAAQQTILALPNTGMAVTIDIGDADNVHPRNKQDVGARLVRIALAGAYQNREIEYSGPVYESMKIEKGAIRLRFTHLGGGLVAKNPPLKRFAIAGADGKFFWADAVIDRDTVVVKSPQVPAPVAVSYAWADNPEGCNLYNAAGLPAVPFRTDRK